MRAVESHSRCLPGTPLELDDATAVFAEDWAFGDGNANVRRSRHSVLVLNAAEDVILSLDDPDDDLAANLTRRADRLERWLEDAAALAAPLDQEAFQTAGTKREIRERPAVFAAVRRRLGI